MLRGLSCILRSAAVVCALLCPCLLLAQGTDVDYVISVLVETLAEQDASVDIEQLEDDLRELAADPVNVNNASTGQLQRLVFLSDDQRLALQLYAWQHSLQSLAELRLVPTFDEYAIRLLTPFVYVGPPPPKSNSFHDWFSRSRHDVFLRADARNLTSFSGDPFYGSFRYRYNAGGHIFFGVNAKRDAGEVFGARSRYGASFEARDLRLPSAGKQEVVLRNVVAGDYRAAFGLGLVLGSGLPFGKSAYASRLGQATQGIRHYGGTSSDFLRGAGATVGIGDVDVTAFYSVRSPDSAYFHHTVGAALTWQRNRLSLAVTAVEDLLSDSLRLRNNYYNVNYFRGQRQFSGSVTARYGFRRVFLLGEAAVSQNSTWGAAVLLGARYVPVQDVSLLALYRWYSPYYDALHASTFSETTRPNDEQGGYLGVDVTRLRNWRFSAYADLFAFSGPKYTIRQPSFGYDWMFLSEYSPSSALSLAFKVRNRRKGDKDTYTFRLALFNALKFGTTSRTDSSSTAPADDKPVIRQKASLSFRTQFDASLCRAGLPLIPLTPADSSLSASGATRPTAGFSFSEQVEYRFGRAPLVLQARVAGFWVPDWNSRIYLYENDVLYAFSVPAYYGIGVRAFLNMRWHISSHYALYLRVSDTWYAPRWVSARNASGSSAVPFSPHRPDIHLMLHIKY